MLMLLTSNNFLQLFFGWEAVGLVSYLLIGFWFKRPTAVFANLKAFLVNRVGDFGFLLGIAGVMYWFGTLDYATVFANASDKIGGGQVVAIISGHEWRSAEHTSELKSLMRISYAVFCLKKKTSTQ